MQPRMKQAYNDEIRPRLLKEEGYPNVMAVPRLARVAVNMGVGDATQNVKVLDVAVAEIATITGQRPSIRRARKSIASFKLREGMPIGCCVTLRRRNMWDFLDRLISVALPRVRDFRGLSPRSFDGRGSYTLGIRDHLIFPEIDYSRAEGAKGLNVTVVTTAPNDEQALFLLRELGMPFASN